MWKNTLGARGNSGGSVRRQTLDPQVWTAAGLVRGSTAGRVWILKSVSPGLHRASHLPRLFLDSLSEWVWFWTSELVYTISASSQRNGPGGCEQGSRSFLPSNQVELGKLLWHKGAVALFLLWPKCSWTRDDQSFYLLSFRKRNDDGCKLGKV